MQLIIKNAHRLTRSMRLRSSYLVASSIFARGKLPLVANFTTGKHRILQNVDLKWSDPQGATFQINARACRTLLSSVSPLRERHIR